MRFCPVFFLNPLRFRPVFRRDFISPFNSPIIPPFISSLLPGIISPAYSEIYSVAISRVFTDVPKTDSKGLSLKVIYQYVRTKQTRQVRRYEAVRISVRRMIFILTPHSRRIASVRYVLYIILIRGKRPYMRRMEPVYIIVAARAGGYGTGD